MATTSEQVKQLKKQVAAFKKEIAALKKELVTLQKESDLAFLSGQQEGITAVLVEFRQAIDTIETQIVGGKKVARKTRKSAKTVRSGKAATVVAVTGKRGRRATATTVAKKRGRPAKKATATAMATESKNTVVKRRGRPRKKAVA